MRQITRMLLEDMLARCERIQTHVHGLSLHSYLASDLVRDAVERNFIALSEMISRISVEDPIVFDEIEASREILGLRHRIAHGYDTEINDEIIWTTIQHSVPTLVKNLNLLLSEADGDPVR